MFFNANYIKFLLLTNLIVNHSLAFSVDISSDEGYTEHT